MTRLWFDLRVYGFNPESVPEAEKQHGVVMVPESEVEALVANAARQADAAATIRAAKACQEVANQREWADGAKALEIAEAEIVHAGFQRVRTEAAPPAALASAPAPEGPVIGNDSPLRRHAVADYPTDKPYDMLNPNKEPS